MGECPDWYPLMRAARWMGVPAWELAEQPQVWTDWALIALAVDEEEKQSGFMGFIKSMFGG